MWPTKHCEKRRRRVLRERTGVAPDEPVGAASVSDARSGIDRALGGAVVVSLKSTALVLSLGRWSEEYLLENIHRPCRQGVESKRGALHHDAVNPEAGRQVTRNLTRLDGGRLAAAIVASLMAASDCGDVPPLLPGLSTSRTLLRHARGVSPFRLTLYAPDSRLTAMSPASPVKDRDNP